MSWGHRVAVLRDGVLQQVGTPRELTERPVNVFVAATGRPAMRLVQGVLAAGLRGPHLLLGNQQLAVPRQVLRQRPALTRYLGAQLAVGLPPECLFEAAPRGSLPGLALRATVAFVEAAGPDATIHCVLDAPSIGLDDIAGAAWDGGADVNGGSARTDGLGRPAPGRSAGGPGAGRRRGR
jgi:multiple sugar transport system ATP-binding protein